MNMGPLKYRSSAVPDLDDKTPKILNSELFLLEKKIAPF